MLLLARGHARLVSLIESRNAISDVPSSKLGFCFPLRMRLIDACVERTRCAISVSVRPDLIIELMISGNMRQIYTHTNRLSTFANVFPYLSTMLENTFMYENPIKRAIETMMRVRGIKNPTQLAEKSNVHQPAISRVLTGKHEKISLDNALRLARALGISIEQLMGEMPLPAEFDARDTCHAPMREATEDDLGRAN